MSENSLKDLPKTYDPKLTEPKWISFWEENHFFKANPHSSKEPFCIVIPPPNVTGVLHMGHALVNTLQDILIRWKRMEGFEALWIPGTDHAGIATQTVVERYLMATQKKRRTDFSREEFLSYVWQWKERHENTIISQLKRMGCSCDWSRLRFTMDEGCNKAVRTIFKKMFDEGLIYRGNYLVNWDPVTQTALADDEVEYEERSSFLWHFKYPFADGSGFVQVATTRPETMLGDTAVAVSPKDERYASLIGKKILLPLMNREIPLIADHHVDPAFGTGMVKVTPAHDPNDYEMGRAHNLEFINILTPDAKINENGGEFQGLTREEARVAVVEKMKSLGYLVKIEPHTLRVGLSYRSKAVIEPYLSKQWFVKMSQFGQALKKVVEDGQVKITPKTWENTYFNWINNLRDWCISRQLWWGHRIPVWYNKSNPDLMICHDGDDLPVEVKANPDLWIQDEDVLDTWFSSGLWPFSTLGWPNKTAELQKFYPNSVLVTGHDILFFWVARMIVMGQYALGEVPFPETFLHGLIYGKSYWRENPQGGITYISGQEKKDYDLGVEPIPKDVKSKWEKLSKSKGNVIDPLELIDDYGTDAMRMALAASATHQPQIDLDRRRFEEFKNFTNKIWNGARFVLMNLAEDEKNGLPEFTASQFSEGLNEELFKLEDRWILSALNRTIHSVKTALSSYSFDQAALTAYDFFWKEFCAYYVEIVKPVLFGKSGTPEERLNKQKILTIVLFASIRLLHPMAPFITEELFQILKDSFKDAKALARVDTYTQEAILAFQSESCSVAPYPKVQEADIDESTEKDFEYINRVLYAIRNIRGEMKIAPGQVIDVYIIGQKNTPHSQLLQKNVHLITSLVKIESILFEKESPTLKFSSNAMVDDLKIVIPLPLELQHKEKERLEKEREKLKKSIERLQAQLENSDFLAKAKPELVEQQKKMLTQSMNELNEIEIKLK